MHFSIIKCIERCNMKTNDFLRTVLMTSQKMIEWNKLNCLFKSMNERLEFVFLNMARRGDETTGCPLFTHWIHGYGQSWLRVLQHLFHGSLKISILETYVKFFHYLQTEIDTIGDIMSNKLKKIGYWSAMIWWPVIIIKILLTLDKIVPWNTIKSKRPHARDASRIQKCNEGSSLTLFPIYYISSK